nr:helix-turn-helix transcriptional regulator [Nonomuraea ceibae]
MRRGQRDEHDRPRHRRHRGRAADARQDEQQPQQRDFEREFGMPYSRVRTKLRLSTSRVLLETQPVAEVARRVGYSSPSAFISAFTKEYGCTPGRYAAT